MATLPPHPTQEVSGTTNSRCLAALAVGTVDRMAAAQDSRIRPAAAADVPAADAPTAPGATPVPFPMPAAIAAQRAGGVGPVANSGGQRTQPATRTDTGL